MVESIVVSGTAGGQREALYEIGAQKHGSTEWSFPHVVYRGEVVSSTIIRREVARATCPTRAVSSRGGL